MSSGSGAPRSRRELVSDVLGKLSPAAERRLLSQLLDAEFLAVQVYALAAGAGPVSAAGQQLASQLGQQERAHAASLAGITGLAGQPAATPPTLPPSAVERELAARGMTVTFRALKTERQWFTLLEDLEHLLEGVYYQALGRLSDPGHATLVARIMASEAQHSTLLFSFRNPQNIQLDVAEGQIKGRPS
jgi:hypothetical protein